MHTRLVLSQCTNLHDLWSQDADTSTRADTASNGDIAVYAAQGIPAKRGLSVWPIWVKGIVGVREEYLGSGVEEPVCHGDGGDKGKDGERTHNDEWESLGGGKGGGRIYRKQCMGTGLRRPAEEKLRRETIKLSIPQTLRTHLPPPAGRTRRPSPLTGPPTCPGTM